MLGPLIGPGSRFLELLVIVDAPGFSSLRLPNAVQRVVYAPGAAAGEIALAYGHPPRGGRQCHPLRPLEGHRLRVGDHLVFRFKLGALEASVRIFTAGGVRRTYP
jgi:hypothetical protein